MNYNMINLEKTFDVLKISAIYYLDMKDLVLRAQNHSFWEIIFVDEGCYSFYLNEKLLKANAGSAVVVAPGSYHVASADSDASKVGLVGFQSNSESLYKISNRIIELDSLERRKLSEVFSTGQRYLDEVIDSESGESYLKLRDGFDKSVLQTIRLKMEEFLLCLYGHNKKRESSAKVSRRNDNLIDEIVDYLRKNINSSIKIEDISEHCGYSVSYIKSVFLKNFGCGILEYFQNLKISAAKKMLRDTDMDISEIAYRLGYCSSQYFTKVFKAKTGVTPTHFAKTVYNETG